MFDIILKLKTVPRTGWKKNLRMARPESVADHAYSVATMAMILSDAKNLDTGKILKMALLHDLTESVIGDLTPDEITKSKKILLENTAMKKILSGLDTKTQKQYWAIWMDYQKSTSKEARLLHDIDKLEMALQADVYRKNGHSAKKLEQFLNYAKKQVKNPELKKMLPNFKN